MRRELIFDFAVFYDVAQYLQTDDLHFVLETLSYRVKVMAFDALSTEHLSELNKETGYDDPYMVKRKSKDYEDAVSRYWVFVERCGDEWGSRTTIWKSKVFVSIERE